MLQQGGRGFGGGLRFGGGNFAQQHEGEQHGEDGDSFDDTDGHQIVREALSRFGEGIAGGGRGTALEDGGSGDGATADDADDQADGPHFRSLVHDLVHEQHAVDGLRHRGAGESGELERGGLALNIALLPTADGGRTGDTATIGGTDGGKTHGAEGTGQCQSLLC